MTLFSKSNPLHIGMKARRVGDVHAASWLLCTIGDVKGRNQSNIENSLIITDFTSFIYVVIVETNNINFCWPWYYFHWIMVSIYINGALCRFVAPLVLLPSSMVKSFKNITIGISNGLALPTMNYWNFHQTKFINRSNIPSSSLFYTWNEW